MVRASGYLQTLDDFNHIVLKPVKMACPFICVMLRRSRLAGDAPGHCRTERRRRSGGRGGILRSGKNAREVIAAVKDKLER